MIHRLHSPLIPAASALAVLLAAGPTHAQNLSVTDGLQLWLKADAGVTTDGSNVVSWTDQSPNAHVAGAPDIPNAPTLVAAALNGKPVLRFDGLDDELMIEDSESLSFAEDMTTFFVVKFDDFSTFRAVWAKTNTNLPAPTDWYALPGSGVPRLYRGAGSAAGIGFFDGGVALRTNTYLTIGFDVAGSQATHYLGSQPTSTGQLNVIAGDSDTPLYIGTRGDLFTRMKGDIAEIVLYNRALSETERTNVVSYLGTKYGIANLPPTASLAVTPAGPSHAAGDVLTLTATATDTDGTIANVRFFANGSLLGTATAPPYTLKVRLDTAGSYDLSVRATDNRDGTADSPVVTRSVTAGAPPSLNVTTNLQLWLKADAGVTTGAGDTVVQWADQSGKNNTAAALDEFVAPTVVANAIGNLPAIRFDGVDDYLEVADSDSISITGDITSFFVVRMDDFATFRSVWAKTSNNLPAPTDFYTLPGSGIPRVFRGDGAASLANVDGSRPLRAGQFDLVGFSAAGTAFTHYLNGGTNGTGASTIGTADLDLPLHIGTRADFVTRLQGDLAELLIYDTALSSADLQSVQLYLAGRYGFPLATQVNAAPTVTLTAPPAGTSVVAPLDVTMTADAADADGTVVRVEFLVNGAVAATDTSAPWSAVINFPTASDASLQARALDNFGAVTVSAPVSMTVTAPEPIPLPALANLRLWLRADKGVTDTAGAVSGWGDQSGNFNNAQQSTDAQQPALVTDAVNGHPVLRFDGVDDSLVINHSPSLAITGDITSFFVVKFDDFATFRAVWAKTNVNFPAPTDFYTLPDSGVPRLLRGNGGGSLASVDGVTAPIAGEFALIGFDMTGTIMRQFFNGELNGEADVVVLTGDSGAPLYIGTRGDQFTRMKGDIAEVILYDAALSEEDRATVTTYLTNRYAIGSQPVEPPQLTIVTGEGGSVTISWPGEFASWILDFSPTLATGSWNPVPNVVGTSHSEIASGIKYFRLRQP